MKFKPQFRALVGNHPSEEGITQLLNRTSTGLPLRGKTMVTVKEVLQVHSVSLNHGFHTPQTLAVATGLSVGKVRACVKYLLRYNFVTGVDIPTDPQGTPDSRELL